MIKNRIILNEKLCTPIGLSEKQIEEAKIFLKKQEEEKKRLELFESQKQEEELKKKKAEYEKLPEEEKKKIGLGDAVALFAKPIAQTIDAITGTDIKNCSGCKKRQEKLNNLIPDIKNPLNNK